MLEAEDVYHTTSHATRYSCASAGSGSSHVRMFHATKEAKEGNASGDVSVPLRSLKSFGARSLAPLRIFYLPLIITLRRQLVSLILDMSDRESCLQSSSILTGFVLHDFVLVLPTPRVLLGLCVCYCEGGEELFALPLTEYPDLDKTRKVHLLRAPSTLYVHI